MLIRSRSARMAGLALLAAPLTVLAASPVFAGGDDAVVSADPISTPGFVHVTSTKGLSRTTIVLCGGSTVVIPSWSGGPLSGDVPFTGTVRAVFQHSGNNTTLAAETLLTSLAGAGAVSGNSTGAIAYDAPNACNTGGSNTDDEGGNRGENGDGDETPVTVTDPGPATSSDPAPSTTTDPAPNTVVESTTLVKAETPAEIPTVVLGETLVAGSELPRTGGNVQPLMLVALSLVGSGMAMRVGSRRIRSASSPS